MNNSVRLVYAFRYVIWAVRRNHTFTEEQLTHPAYNLLNDVIRMRSARSLDFLWIVLRYLHITQLVNDLIIQHTSIPTSHHSLLTFDSLLDQLTLQIVRIGFTQM
jgi:hypothetical protein